MTAGAVDEAATILRGQLLAMAAHILGVPPDRIELGSSRATAVDDPTKSVGFADLAYRAHYEPQQLPAGMSATLEATARFTSQTLIHWANATHACTCEVDVTRPKSNGRTARARRVERGARCHLGEVAAAVWPPLPSPRR